MRSPYACWAKYVFKRQIATVYKFQEKLTVAMKIITVR